MTAKKKAQSVKEALTGPYLVEPGFDVNVIVRNEPSQVALTFAVLADPGPHLATGRFGYVEIGGGLFYRPVGFDLDLGAVICSRVRN